MKYLILFLQVLILFSVYKIWSISNETYEFINYMNVNGIDINTLKE